MQFRARAPNGKNVIIKLDEAAATVQELRDAIAKNISEAKEGFTMTLGFPPKTINLDTFASDRTLSAAGLKLNNESIQVIPIVTEPENSIQPKAGLSSAASQKTPPPIPTSTKPKQPTSTKPRPKAASSSMVDQDVPSIPLPSRSSTLTLRVMPDDNSCLFRAIAAATNPSSSSDYVSLLRYQIANYVTSNSSDYPNPVLDGRTPDAYAAWIQQESSWGGDVELDVLSRVLGVEIWCCQVDPFFVRKYNEGESGEFIVLVYSGIHYDTVTVSPSLEDILPPEFDVSKFSNGEDSQWVLEATKALCEKLKERGYMTNTSSFGVMCKVGGCGWVGQGEKAAVEHAKKTGHTDLEEIT